MKPYPVTFYVYADDENQIKNLRSSLFDLVNSYYNEGIFISAKKLDCIIRNFSSNPIVKNYLK